MTGFRRFAMLAGLVVIYYLAGRLGLALAFVNASTTAVWPPTGIALAALLILGDWAWPAVYVGAFLVNVTTGGALVPALFIATGNSTEALIGAYLVRRYASGRQVFDHPRSVMRYTVLVALGSTLIAATVGTTALAVSGQAAWSDYGRIWVTWWFGDAGGDFVVAPLILLWNANYAIRWDLRRSVEGALALVASALAAALVFGRLFPTSTIDYPLSFLPMPVFIWAAFRFGRRGAAASVAVVYAVAVAGTLQGFGPFGGFPRWESLVLLQGFTCISSLTALLLAAVMLERRRVEEQLRTLAVSDPLTGLSNYGRLMEVLEAEVQRSLRTQRPFAILFMDMDRLKWVNDHYGHLVGSRALWRVAEALRKTCRAMDTAARYGGDEFALVLPESDDVAAERVARRLAELLAADREVPPVTVSSGIAAYPKDGTSVAELLDAADRMLYGAKQLTRAPDRLAPR